MKTRDQHKEEMGIKYGVSGMVLDKAHHLAWGERHHAGLSEVEDLFEDISDIIDEVDASHLPSMEPTANTPSKQGGA